MPVQLKQNVILCAVVILQKRHSFLKSVVQQFAVMTRIEANNQELFDSKIPQRSLHRSFVDFILFVLFDLQKNSFLCIGIVAIKSVCLSVIETLPIGFGAQSICCILLLVLTGEASASFVKTSSGQNNTSPCY